MSKFLDNIAINHRIYSVVGSVVVLGSILILALLSSRTLINSEGVDATVIEVKMHSSDSGIAFVKLKLSNNKELRVFSTIIPLPKVGDAMPMILETYENNEEEYYINHKKWREKQLFY